MRYKGLTESKFLPLLHADIFHKLHDHFSKLNNNQPLTDNKASSKKMKRQTKMISWIKNSLKEYGKTEKLKDFNTVIDNYERRRTVYVHRRSTDSDRIVKVA